jgi:pilus assembly protein CpaF
VCQTFGRNPSASTRSKQNTGIYNVAAGVTFHRQLSPIRKYDQFEAAKLLAFECFAIETASTVKRENIKAHPHHPGRFPVDQVDDGLHCTYPLSCELGISVPCWIAAHLADGSRVNVVAPPLSLNGPCISIRKFSRSVIDFNQFVARGSVSRELGRVLEIAARCRLNIIISGGTGSGKTTLLNAMSRMINPDERIVTIEDTAELQLQQTHVIRLETRPPNVEGQGEVTQRDLVRNALRMRPDRIIVGEVRGAEAFDMMQAMNTGHNGSMSTIHANSARDTLARIENMILMANANLPIRAIRGQIVSAIDLVIQTERMRDGVRRVTEVVEIAGLEDEVISLGALYAYRFLGENADGSLRGVFESSRARPRFLQRLQYFGLDKAFLEAMNPQGGEPE